MNTVKPRVCLLGCGYVLSKLTEHLNPETTILTARSKNKLKSFKEQGFTIVSLDLNQASQVDDFLNNYQFDILIDSIPPVVGESSGHQEFIQKLSKAKPSLLTVFLSTTGVYGETDGGVVTEESKLSPITTRSEARVEVEKIYAKLIANHIILRLPAISGPERNPKDSFLSGRYPYLENGTRFTNRIHVNDLVNILLLIIQSNKDLPKILNVTDGANLTTKELLEVLQKKYPEIKTPNSMTLEEAKSKGYYTMLGNQRVSNQLLIDTFGNILRFKGTDWM